MANTLNEYQQKVVDEIERNICVISSAASGKAICNSDFVPTPDGMRRVSDIREGDYLFDRLGRPTKVLGVFPQGEKEVWEITFGDGRTARCSDEHIWRVNKTTWSNKDKWKDMTLKEIMSKPLINKDRAAYFRIPNSHAVEYSKKDYKVNPYIIGAFLGDGCCLQHALTISCGDSESCEVCCFSCFDAFSFRDFDAPADWSVLLEELSCFLDVFLVMIDEVGVMEVLFVSLLTEIIFFPPA